MSDNLKELERCCNEATATMRRIVSGVGSQYTLAEGEAAIRAMGEAGKAWQIAKMSAEVDATVASMIETMRDELAKVDRRDAAIVQRGRESDHSRN